MRLPDKFGIIANCAVSCWILYQRTEDSVVEFAARVIVDLNFDAERFRARAHDFDGLRMAIVGDEKSSSIGSDGATKRHRFGRGRCFIEQRRVGDIELRKIDNHGLEIEQRFEPALRELRLVGCVGGVPARIFENIALNNRRGDAIVITSADKRARNFVFCGERAQLGQCFGLRLGLRQMQLSI